MASTNGTVGASRPPPGVTPNFANPKSIGYQIIIVAVVCPIFTIAICLLRLYTAHNIIKFHLDDCESFDVRFFFLLSISH